ncbi:small multi-drug export protein [archaeon]|nr:small multi-drug export protein [archaeon]
MIEMLRIALLSILPISELRGAIPYALSLGINPIIAFFFAVAFNILVFPLVFFFLDKVHHKLMKYFSYYNKFFNFYINKNRKKLEKHVGTNLEFLFIMLLTAIPLPFTGAYTASILSWFFGIKRNKAFLAVSLGVIIAGILVTLATLGIFSIL